METVDTLKTAVLEFINKLYPALPESLMTIATEFKELLNNKSPIEIYNFVQNLPILKKNDSTSSSNEPQLSKVAKCGFNPLQVCSQKDSDEKSQNSSTEKYQQLKIEINKNFFLKPTTKFAESHANKPNKNVDIEVKVQRENIKLVDTLKAMPKMNKSCFAEKTGVLNQIHDALTQFKKDCSTINTVYERSTEISTPQTPGDIKMAPQQYFYFQQLPQPQVCQFKGYSVYSKRGITQPIQFDLQFQLMQQQFQNQLIYKKLYF